MTILSISGSTRTCSTNSNLLDAFPTLFPSFYFTRYTALDQLPLFQADKDRHPWPEQVLAWRQAVASADALIISTPVYIYNMPAVLKNALEWLTSSGELMHKRVLAITFTPNAPRGEKAMQSLLWSLQALDAKVVGQLPLYQTEIKIKEGKVEIEEEIREMIKEAVKQVIGGY